MDITAISFTESGNEVSLKTDVGYFDISRADFSAFLYEFTDLSVTEAAQALPIYTEGEAEESLVFYAEKLKAIKYAVYILGISDKSTKQLRSKLKLKGYSERACDDALYVLKKNGYLSDERFCRRKCETLSSGKLYGRRRIISELMAKGISHDMCEGVLADMEIDFYENLCRLFEKLTRGEIPETREQKKKISDKLLRYGYSFDEINEVFCEYTDIQ